jgi:hypothetical protein
MEQMKIGDLVRVFNFESGIKADNPHAFWNVGIIISDPTQSLITKEGAVFVMVPNRGMVWSNIKRLIKL